MTPTETTEGRSHGSSRLEAAVDWRAPHPGGWARDFRFGEWLGEPVTPLFETMLLPALETAFWDALRRLTGMPTPQPTYIVVRGWYFTSLNFWPAHPLGWLWRIARHPRLLRVMLQFVPRLADWALAPWVRAWREDGLPQYRAVVSAAEQRVEDLPPAALPELVQTTGAAAGAYFAWIALVAGAGYKTEAPLARFARAHLSAALPGGYQVLLAGPTGAAGSGRTHSADEPGHGTSSPDAHALHSLDWFHPTLGEALGEPFDGADGRRENAGAAVSDDPTMVHTTHVREAARERVAHAERAARLALAAHPRRLKEFDRLLTTARRYAALREQIVREFTRAWPVLRRAALRMGESLVAASVLEQRDQIFFVTAVELSYALDKPAPAAADGGAITAGLSAIAARRRDDWEARRTLAAPLTLGHAPAAFQRGLEQLRADFGPLMPAGARSPAVLLRGQPASPGRAAGPARIIRGPAEFHRLQSGDVLVAPATAPAWTPLFARAAAVVTDTGSLLAHTSLVAREFGIPAVVGTATATAQLHDGQLVSVDGSAGTVSCANLAGAN